MMTVFLRVLEAEDKAEALHAAILEPATRRKQRFEVDVASFAAVPGSPFAYWISDRVRRLFIKLPPFESKGRTAKVGLQTSDDFRFARAWWSLPPKQLSERWFPFAKGGTFSSFYSDLNLVVNWETDGKLMKAWAGSLYNNSHWSRIIKNTDFYFRPGLRWTRTALGYVRKGVGMATLPAGCIFNDKSCSVFVDEDSSDELRSLLAIFSSICVDSLIRTVAHSRSWELGHILVTPLPEPEQAVRATLAALSQRTWSGKRSLDTHNEISHAFVLPALLQVTGDTVTARADRWAEHFRTTTAALAAIQAEIDERCFDLYGIDEANRRAITEGFGGGDSEATTTEDTNEGEDDGAEDDSESDSTVDGVKVAAELVSWAVGVAFGRFDMRLATGARPMPTEPEPFDPLPACSPGMLTGGDGLPLARQPAGYPLAFPEAGVLVDDLGHAQDLPTAVRAVFDVVFGSGADRWWNDVAALLDPKGHDLRVWLAGSFFEHHLKRYSKSRRKAPILWQLGTPSGRYSVWLYAYRLTHDSFFQLQNEVVGPKLTHEERQLTSLMQNTGGSPSAPQRKEIAALEAIVEDLRAMLDEVKRVAPLWNPNLDDGVVLTMAPLWRLVPQHKPWQKELKGKWDELAEGKYDWAHLAMHLWPERVVPKCATDRSLAIAHGVEDVFWVEGAEGKWKSRTTPVRPVDELVRERSSSAVKAALKSLLDAPTASGPGRAGGRRAASSAATEGGSR